MSSAIFPTLPGLGWGGTRTPVWSTQVQRSVSGRETRAADWTYPQWKWSLPIEFLRSLAPAELQTLAGFYNARQGQFDSFLFADPVDNAATAQQIGIGDGATAQFQLVRAFGGFLEPVTAPNLSAPCAISVNGTVASPSTYTVLGWGNTDPGTVNFAAAPAAGAVILASFAFLWPCRFTSDNVEFENFLAGYWSVDKLEFQSLKGNG